MASAQPDNKITAEHEELHNAAMKMEELRQQEFNTDITIDCNGGVIYAHKFVLITSSPYFEKMLTIDMFEKNSGHVNFEKYAKDVIEIIIKYLYTAQLPDLTNDYDLLQELIQICHLMENRKLLIHAWNEITKHLNLQTFAQLWAYAVNFGLEKTETIETFAKENLYDISKHVKLLDLNENQVAKLIKCIDHKKFCNLCIECIFFWNHDGLREESAAKLMHSVDLEYLDDLRLHELLKNRKHQTSPTVENVLVNEAISRLPERYQTCQTIVKSIFENCTQRCERPNRVDSYTVLECKAERGLNNVKNLCDKLKAEKQVLF